MGRSVSDAAAQAVEKSNKKESAERSPTQIIADVRNHAQSGLAVPSADILFILSVLDSNRSAAIQSGSQVVELQEVNTILNENIAQLIAQVEQYREYNYAQLTKGKTWFDAEVSGGHTDEFIAGVAGALNASTSGE